MGRLVFDIDGIICNFVDGFLAFAAEEGGYEGMPCCWQSVDKYQFFASENAKNSAPAAAPAAAPSAQATPAAVTQPPRP